MDLFNGRRRILQLSAALAGAAVMPAEASQKPAKGLIEIEAPTDVFVVSVAKANGSVNIGNLLISLKSYLLLEWRNKLTLLGQQLEIAERPFLDGRVDEQIAMLKQKSEDFSEMNKVVQEQRNLVQESYDLGLASRYDLDTAIASARRTHSEYLDTNMSATQSERKKKDAFDKLQIAKAKLEFHEKRIAELEVFMQVRCGVKGTFRSHVTAGSFVKKGHILGSIEP